MPQMFSVLAYMALCEREAKTPKRATQSKEATRGRHKINSCYVCRGALDSFLICSCSTEATLSQSQSQSLTGWQLPGPMGRGHFLILITI